MAIEKEDKKGKEKKGSSKGIERSGLKEERMGEDFVIKRVLESVRSGKEDKEAFEELRRINKEKREEIGEERSNMIGKELIEECDRYRDASVEKVVKLILEGANLNLQEDKNGHTALINASFYNYNEIVEILCKCGANLDLQSYTFGYTALIEAVGEDNKKIVERLLKYGANPFLEDNQGKTAMDWARSKDTKEMLAKHTAEIILDKIDKGKILDEKEEKMKGLALRFTLKECDKRAVKILENII